MRQWMVAAKKADFYAIAEKFHVDPVVARIIRNREVIGEKNIRIYLDKSGYFDKIHVSAIKYRYLTVDAQYTTGGRLAGGDSCTKDPETGAYPDYRRL